MNVISIPFFQPRTRKPSGCKAYPLLEGHFPYDFVGMRLNYSTDPSEETGLFSKRTVVKGKCEDGYIPSYKNADDNRPLRKKCKRNGEWVGRGDGMRCDLITCPSLQETGYLTEDVIVLPNSCSGGVGGNVPDADQVPVKSKCRFSCKDKVRYKLVGSKIARCTKNSGWKLKGGRPKCTMRHRYRKMEEKAKRKNNKKKKKRLKVKNDDKTHDSRHPNPSQKSDLNSIPGTKVSNFEVSWDAYHCSK